MWAYQGRMTHGHTTRIIVNGMSEEVPENATLAFLIELFKEADPALIVEHNGRFVYPSSMTLRPWLKTTESNSFTPISADNGALFPLTGAEKASAGRCALSISILSGSRPLGLSVYPILRKPLISIRDSFASEMKKMNPSRLVLASSPEGVPGQASNERRFAGVV